MLRRFGQQLFFSNEAGNIRTEVLWLCDNSHSDPRHMYHQSGQGGYSLNSQKDTENLSYD